VGLRWSIDVASSDKPLSLIKRKYKEKISIAKHTLAIGTNWA
jgi:hypothetical protein